MHERLKAFCRNETGATAIEYSLIAALIAVVVLASVTLIGTETQSLFEAVSTKVSEAVGTALAAGEGD